MARTDSAPEATPTPAPTTPAPPTARPTATATATATPAPTASPIPTNTPSPTPSPPPTRILLAAVGDVMLGRSVGWRMEAEGPAMPFASVRDILAGADIAVANLESAVGVTGTAESKAYTFRAPPVAAEALALAGFDLVSLANNHSLDYGPQSLAETRALLAGKASSVPALVPTGQQRTPPPPSNARA